MVKKRVLIVDDDVGILELLKIALENDYTVDSCEDETDLKIAISRNKPDIILLDASIPGIDGISMCRGLKRSDVTSGIPIIVITAYSDDRTKHDAYFFGADDFISKPFDVKDLKNRIESLI